MTFKDKSKYTGHFKEDYMDGEGILEWNNGYHYQGTFEEGTINGKGKIVSPENDYYEGELVNNTFHGKGKFVWSSGEEYEGAYIFGQKEGKGKYTLNAEEYYEGDFFEDVPHGKGKFVCAKKTLVAIWRSGEYIETISENLTGDQSDQAEPDLNFEIKKETIKINDLPYIEHQEDDLRNSALQMNQVLDQVEFNLDMQNVKIGKEYQAD